MQCTQAGGASSHAGKCSASRLCNASQPPPLTSTQTDGGEEQRRQTAKRRGGAQGGGGEGGDCTAARSSPYALQMKKTLHLSGRHFNTLSCTQIGPRKLNNSKPATTDSGRVCLLTLNSRQCPPAVVSDRPAGDCGTCCTWRQEKLPQSIRPYRRPPAKP